MQGSPRPAVTMGNGAELHLKGSGSITIHGSSNYYGGGDAVRGGNLNYYQGLIDSKTRGIISAEDVIFESGAINGKGYQSDTTDLPTAAKTLCTSVTLNTVPDAAYKMDSGEWQDSPF